MLNKIASLAFILVLGTCLSGCSGDAENEVIVPDPDVTYSGDYSEDSPEPTYE
ncbi:secreted protein [Rhodopirellula sallentina]|uniref:Secreted protein n=1 Tax=Rhodopirellula sallentina SM41 TaxID=1263870 RepID=M5U774_9BACT|nr:secreted protein [Rhodopirellula sallentina]EMI51798.1 secreted protein [Rhodopirellula sallentina SM41]